MNLSELRPADGSKQERFRKGRGHGSSKERQPVRAIKDRRHVPGLQSRF